MTYLYIVDALGTSCPTVGIEAGAMAMGSRTSSPCRGGGHLHSDHVSPAATHAPHVRTPAHSTSCPPPSTRNQRAHGVRLGKHNIV